MRTLLAASVTPLRQGGHAIDEAAIPPLVAHLREHGVDGVFACGTTGEGVLLTLEERRRAALVFREACDGTLIVHCGAQTTADTAALAAHAAEIEADGAAVIPPPYYELDEPAVLGHMLEAARACAPLPFYLYAFRARSGYPLTPELVARMQDAAPNLAGLKVSESPYTAVEPYLALGLPVFVGSEPLVPQALEAGAAGSVSGLAAAFPADLRAMLDDPTGPTVERVRELRDTLSGPAFIPSLKHVLGQRGVPVNPDVRRPLRPLTDAERLTAERLAQPVEAA